MKNLDLTVFNSIHGLAGKSRLWDKGGYFLAHVLTFFLGAAALVFALSKADYFGGNAIFLALELLAAFLIGRALLATTFQHLVRRERPYVSLGFKPLFTPVTRWAMPSGHMAALFAIGFVMFALDAAWGIAYLSAAVLVGVGRVFAGLHWPSDILAGAILGWLSGWLVWFFLAPFSFALFFALVFG